MNCAISMRTVEGRTHIEVEVTPQTPEARALLRAFRAGVRDFEKNWKAMVKARGKVKKKATVPTAPRAARAKRAR